MRQKQQVLILNDFNVVVFSSNPEVGNSLTYVWHFSDCFLCEYYSTRTGGHHHEQTTGSVTLIDRSLKPSLGCWRDGQRFSLDGLLHSV